jgi:ribosome-binding ATPase YchF (GTP1/OBG family)
MRLPKLVSGREDSYDHSQRSNELFFEQETSRTCARLLYTSVPTLSQLIAQAVLTPDSFTTIDPQRAIGYLQIECPCQRYNVSDRCQPNYGGCYEGRRSVPIELLDVAGLVPGAHQGRGLGNKFLDDLRHADALIHVVDVSGTTDAEGKLGVPH